MQSFGDAFGQVYEAGNRSRIRGAGATSALVIQLRLRGNDRENDQGRID